MTRFHLARAVRAAAVLALVAAPAEAQRPAAAAARAAAPTLPVQKFTLPNGLTVLVSEDHSAPIVAVGVRYHVGSKDERAGRTGFAHLFEHMMFQGSQHIESGRHLKVLEEMGADVNGFTTEDYTHYYEVVPSNELEAALWLESDRMGFLLPAVDQAKLDVQRDVVKNERRQRFENEPFGVAPEHVLAALYPRANPYSWSVIGSMADLSAASLDDVKDFFRRYYAPNNATLVLVGDVTPAQVRPLVAKWFGGIPRGPAITRPAIAPVTLAADKRLVLEDPRARLPQLRMAWPTVGEDSPDAPALLVLSRLLSQDRIGRLSKLLVYDREVATAASAGQVSFLNAGRLQLNVTPRPGVALTRVEGLVDSVIAGVVAAAPTVREVERVKNYIAVSAVSDLESVLTKSLVLAAGQSAQGDPLAYRRDYARVMAVTPADVQRVARRYLGAGKVVLSMVPGGQAAQASRPELPSTNVTAAPAAQ